MPFTLLDFPGEMACVAWFSGCNMRCVYCHNPDIVLGQGTKSDDELLSFLETRQGRLTGVVFSGGEATLYKGLRGLIEKVKAMGFKIKLDTNGTRPAVVADLLAAGLLDYVALDYKSPRVLMKAITGNDKYWDDFQQSLGLLIQASAAGMGFEVRTTVHPDLMDVEALAAIIDDLDRQAFAGTYYIQNIASTGDKTLGGIAEPSGQLARDKLPVPRHFKLAYRNFTDPPAQK